MTAADEKGGSPQRLAWGGLTGSPDPRRDRIPGYARRCRRGWIHGPGCDSRHLHHHHRGARETRPAAFSFRGQKRRPEGPEPGRFVLDQLREKLNGEAEALLHELSVTLPREIEKAVAQGDLRENAEYAAALERQQLVRAKLDHIARRLSEISEIDLDAVPTDRVGFGSQVVVHDLDDDVRETYTLAFGDMIDLDSSEISMASPIGKALLGRSVGDEIEVALPGGRLRYRVEGLLTLHELGSNHDSNHGPDHG